MTEISSEVLAAWMADADERRVVWLNRAAMLRDAGMLGASEYADSLAAILRLFVGVIRRDA